MRQLYFRNKKRSNTRYSIAFFCYFKTGIAVAHKRLNVLEVGLEIERFVFSSNCLVGFPRRSSSYFYKRDILGVVRLRYRSRIVSNKAFSIRGFFNLHSFTFCKYNSSVESIWIFS